MENLEEEGRHLTEFLAMLAHELRNPLAPIRNALAIISCARGLPPQVAWSRDVIERQTAQLVRLVDDLLDVSRITRGKLRMKSGADGPERRGAARDRGGPAAGGGAPPRAEGDARRQPDRGQRRHDAPRAGHREPAQQRGQVHVRRRPHRALDRRRGSRSRGPRARQRRRHPAAAARARLRRVRAGRAHARPLRGRARHRPHARPGASSACTAGPSWRAARARATGRSSRCACRAWISRCRSPRSARARGSRPPRATSR